jgi:hypothetical protein
MTFLVVWKRTDRVFVRNLHILFNYFVLRLLPSSPNFSHKICLKMCLISLENSVISRKSDLRQSLVIRFVAEFPQDHKLSVRTLPTSQDW